MVTSAQQARGSIAMEPTTGQAGRPSGIGGIVTGMLMRWLNAEMNRVAADRLDPQHGERILEIGFGPGHLIEMLAARKPALVAGIDHSATMFEQAQHRNAEALRERRVELTCRSVAELPWLDGSFDKIVAVNSFQFWPEPARNLEEVRRVMKPGALLLLVIRGRKANSNATFAGADRGEQYLSRALFELPHAGFDEITHQTREAWPYPAICVRARKPA